MLIQEVARLAGMSKDGIRHYETMGLIGSTPRKAGSRTYRDYDPRVLATIEQVRQAQRLGLSLAEIAPLLKTYDAATITASDTITFLEARLVAVREKIEKLREVERFITDKIALYQRSA